MKKKLLILGVAALSVLALSGCSSKGSIDHNQIQNINQGNGVNGKSGNRQEPPQEALDACSGKAEGDTCQFTMNGSNGSRDVSGTCNQGRQSGELMCFSGQMGHPRSSVNGNSDATSVQVNNQ